MHHGGRTEASVSFEALSVRRPGNHVMNISPFRQAENVAVKGSFYCAFDPVTRQIQLTVEASSVEEAHQRMVTVAGLCGFTKADELFLVVLEDAPRGVPTYFTAFFVVPRFRQYQPELAIGAEAIQ
jgi:hypothetical protein